MHGAIHLFDRLPQVDVGDAWARARATAPVRGEPLVGLIRNPHSHGNEKSPQAESEQPGVIVASPERRDELPAIIADFVERRVDYIAINGGDGTVRDVLSCGAGYFGESWPALILLPSGKTNALGHELGVPTGWPLAEALEAAKRGSVVERRPLVVSQADDSRAQVSGFVLGAGAYTAAISLGQDAHDLGAFDAAAVGVTAAWSVLQAFFGRADNRWRRGTRLRLREPGGAEIRHSGGAPADERYLIFASTLRDFPAGLRPFGETTAPMQLAVFDNSARSLLLRLPAIVRGKGGEKIARLGYHTHALESFDFDIEDRFILDGEAFPPGSYHVTAGPRLTFVVP